MHSVIYTVTQDLGLARVWSSALLSREQALARVSHLSSPNAHMPTQLYMSCLSSIITLN